MRRFAPIGLSLLLCACEARAPSDADAAPSGDDAATTAFPAPDVQPEAIGEAGAEPAPDSGPAAPTPAPRRNPAPAAPVRPSSEPPVEVDPVVVIGPRDGQTLGEYRARADRLFRRLDVDGDGRLDREEIVSGPATLSLLTTLEQHDLDLDQALSHQEYGDLVTRAFQRLDADGNGVVTEAEMQAGDPLGTD